MLKKITGERVENEGEAATLNALTIQKRLSAPFMHIQAPHALRGHFLTCDIWGVPWHALDVTSLDEITCVSNPSSPTIYGRIDRTTPWKKFKVYQQQAYSKWCWTRGLGFTVNSGMYISSSLMDPSSQVSRRKMPDRRGQRWSSLVSAKNWELIRVMCDARRGGKNGWQHGVRAGDDGEGGGLLQASAVTPQIAGAFEFAIVVFRYTNTSCMEPDAACTPRLLHTPPWYFQRPGHIASEQN